MAKLKEIKIFLGSSIVEFEHERNEFKNFIFDMSAKFENSYNTRLIPLMCEDVDPCYAEEPTQNIINRMVLSSDLCFFIFFTKAGEFTQLEFDIAKTQFEKNKKPKIYLYFKELGENKPEQSLIDFKTYYEKTLKQYTPKPFVHIDTIKLRLLQTVAETELKDIVDIKLESDKILVDGSEILSTENIAEFANNLIFKKLSANREAVESEFYKLKVKYKKGECSDREYFNVIKEKEQLDTQIEELRKTIFNMSLRMCRDEVRGEITQRQREAYRLFEAGDLEEANRILNDKDITKAYKQDKADRKEEQKIKTRAYIGELRTKIEILTVMPNITKFEEIEKLYDTIVPEAFEQKVEIDVIRDFAWFLYYQNKLEKAYTIAKRLENLIADDDNEQETAHVYHLLATVSTNLSSKKDETIEYYDKVIAIRERLAKSNPERFDPDLAMSYNNAGAFYYTQGQPKKAEDFFYKSIAIYEKLAKSNPDRFEPDLATSYNNEGALYYTQGQPKKAEEFYNKAIAIREKLAKSNPDRFEPDLADSYNNAGVFYDEHGQPQKAEEFYNKAIAIYKRLAKSNPDRFEPDLAGSYNNAGEFYRIHGQPQKAEDFYNKAIAIYEKLAKSNPDRFEPYLAGSYNNAGNFYQTQGQPKKAEDFYNKAIAIREKLAKSNPDRFEPDLASSYNNAGNFYKDQGQPQKAEDFYNKAIAIYEKLAKSNPDRFEPDLAMSYFNYAIFKDDNPLFKKAYNLAKKHPYNLYCRQIIERLKNKF